MLLLAVDGCSRDITAAYVRQPVGAADHVEPPARSSLEPEQRRTHGSGADTRSLSRVRTGLAARPPRPRRTLCSGPCACLSIKCWTNSAHRGRRWGRTVPRWQEAATA